jgi:hypothetical protein
VGIVQFGGRQRRENDAEVRDTERRRDALADRYTEATGEAPRPRATSGKRFRSSEPLWWAWLDLNQRPHPYQVSRAERCADRRLRRSRASVTGEGLRSNAVTVQGPAGAASHGLPCWKDWRRVCSGSTWWFSGGGEGVGHGQGRLPARPGGPAASDLLPHLDHAKLPPSRLVSTGTAGRPGPPAPDPIAVPPDGRLGPRTSCRTRPLRLLHADPSNAAMRLG